MTVPGQLVAHQEDPIVQEILTAMAEKHLRIAVVGNVDAGKSTFIGTQVSGELDDGRGQARKVIMTHKHELETGRTSTITTHCAYVNKDATPLVQTSKNKNNEKDIVQKAARVITFMDLAGHEKYLRTTVAGISQGMADYALVLVHAGRPPNHITLSHLRLCAAMNIPVIVVLTKVDRVSTDHLRETKRQVQHMLRDSEVGLRPFVVRSSKDIVTVVDKVSDGGLTPVVSVSCVTGEGLDTIRKLLLALPQRRQHAKKQKDKPFEFLVTEIFQVPGVGKVLSGFVTRGQWTRGMPLHLGPLKDGSTVTVTPKSAHVARTSVDQVWAGHSVCFAITLPRHIDASKLAKYMVATKDPIVLTKTFRAKVALVKGKTMTLTKDRTVLTAHILNNKQSVKIIDIQNSQGEDVQVIRQGASAIMTFQFTDGRQYVRSGMRLILRDGPIRGYGVVVS